MSKPEGKWDCNKSGCPGMAHPCTRMSYWQAGIMHAKGEHSFPIAEAFRIQCVQHEAKIQELKDELLEAYRKIR